MTNNTQEKSQSTFDLHVLGAGYLYRLRKVSVKRGSPYWAVTVGALHGKRDEDTGRFESTYIDCRVVGGLAVKRIEELVEAGYFTPTSNGKYENTAQIFIRFKLGDITSGFFWGNNQKTGDPEPVPTISGRVLQIKSAKVKTKDQEKAFPFDFVNQPQAFGSSQPQGSDPSQPQGSDPSQSQGSTELCSGNSSEKIEDSMDIQYIKQDDPNFIRKATELGGQGYSYDEQRGGFVRLAA